MKDLKEKILEKLTITKDSKISNKYCPKDKKELQQIIKDLIKERGNKADLNVIDTSEIKDMSELFMNSNFDGDISNWDVSNVENMSHMFYNSNFNGDISEWNVSKVENMSCIFSWSRFNSDISGWDVSKVKNMDGIFFNCPLEKNPPKWYKK